MAALRLEGLVGGPMAAVFFVVGVGVPFACWRVCLRPLAGVEVTELVGESGGVVRLPLTVSISEGVAFCFRCFDRVFISAVWMQQIGTTSFKL